MHPKRGTGREMDSRTKKGGTGLTGGSILFEGGGGTKLIEVGRQRKMNLR